MNLSGYIIERYNQMKGSYTCHRLEEEAKTLGIDLRTIGINDCCVTHDGIINSGVNLKRRDFIINRYKWGKIKDRINRLGGRQYNERAAFDVYINKFEQTCRLQSKCYSTPRNILATNQYPYDDVTRVLGCPFVAKGLESSMGREIRLINSNEGYLNLSDEFPNDKEWLFEEYISACHGSDVRLFSIRGEAVACMRRTSSSDFRANVALGATVERMDIDDRLQGIARELHSLTKLDIIGIDLLPVEDDYYLCEVNVMPGLEGIEKATETNIAGKIMTMILNDFRDGQE